MTSPADSLNEEARHNTLVRLSGFMLGALLPFILYFSTKSATLFGGIAAILALWGVYRAARWIDLQRLIALPESLFGGLVAAFLCYAAASILWSVVPETSALAFGELAIALFVSVGIALAYRIILPYRFGFGIALGLIAAALYAILEFRLGLKMRGMIGIRNYPFVFNRSIVYQALLLWPMLLLIERRSRLLAGLAFIMLCIAITVSESGAAAMGIVAGIACALLASVASRVTPILIAAGMVIYSLLAPFLGHLLATYMPAKAGSLLSGAHAIERIEIWHAFGELWKQEPLFGIGVGGSARALAHPSAAAVDPVLRPLLEYNHPHNAFLQVWVELGLIGAALVTMLLATCVLAINRLPRRARIAASGFAGAALAIMAVSHGAWQGWWLTTVSLFAAIFWAAQEEDHVAY